MFLLGLFIVYQVDVSMFGESKQENKRDPRE